VDEIIKTVRLARGLSQKELAGKVGVDQSAVAQWESGKTAPRFSRLAKIAEVLECSIEELVKEES